MTRAPMAFAISTAASPTPAARSQYQHRFARLELRAFFERVVGCAIDHGEAACGFEIHARRDDGQAIDGRDHILGKAAPVGKRRYPLARPQMINPETDGDDGSRHFAARRERERRLHLVLVLDDQRVGKIQPGRMHAHDHFARAGLGHWQSADRQALRQAVVRADQGLHVLDILLGLWFGQKLIAGVARAPMTRPAGSIASGLMRAAMRIVPACWDDIASVAECSSVGLLFHERCPAMQRELPLAVASY